MTDDIRVAVKGHAHPNTIFHALNGYFFLHLTMAALARIYCKSRSTISGWIKRYNDSGLVGRTQSNNRAKKFSHDQRLWIYNYFMVHPVSYLHEARKAFMSKWRQTISTSTIWAILHNEFHLTWKTLERRAKHVREADIWRFVRELASINWCKVNLVFLDEVSFDNRGMLRRAGYGKKGKPLIYRGEYNRLPRVSMLVFITVFGVASSFITEGTFTRQKFFDTCQNFAKSGEVNPYPGYASVWIMDGARIHCHPTIINYLRSQGIIPLFLPAYCPFFNPIEILFGLIKKRMRLYYQESKLTRKNLPHFVLSVVNTFKHERLDKLFAHCGYGQDGVFDLYRAYQFKDAQVLNDLDDQ